MRCPYCSYATNRVIDSRLGREGAEIRRRRECAECGRRFTTRERVDEVLPRVVKRDERRELFERDKLMAALEKACHKRPVSADSLERAADRVAQKLQEFGEKEVTSQYVGERVLEELVGLDALAASRFASIFHNFQGPEDYEAFFQQLGSGGRKRPAAKPPSS